jgi:hypothetical protein
VKFFEGIKNITRSLQREHITRGIKAANDMAGITYSEYMNTKEKSLFDYGIMIGALEWLEESKIKGFQLEQRPKWEQSAARQVFDEAMHGSQNLNS